MTDDGKVRSNSLVCVVSAIAATGGLPAGIN